MFFTYQLDISQLPKKVHENQDYIITEAYKISLDYRIVNKQHYNKHTTMAGFLYPNGAVPNMIQLVVLFDVLYYVNDLFAEDAIGNKEQPNILYLLDAWKGDIKSMPPSDNFYSLYHTIYQCGQNILSLSNPIYFKKITQLIKNHLQEMLAPKLYKSIEEYKQSRLHSSGMLVTIELINIVTQNFLPNYYYDEFNLLTILEYQCAMIGAISNDLFSYKKENNSDYNYVCAQMPYENKTYLHHAISNTIKELNLLLAKYNSYKSVVIAQLNTSTSIERKKILSHLENLDFINAASYHWQNSTDRYKAKNHILEDLRC